MSAVTSALKALKSALMAWVAISLLVAGVLILADLLIDNGSWSAILAALSSAMFSIAGALLITEVILKPLYVRDILQVAQLSGEVYEAGIRSIRLASETRWEDCLFGNENVEISVGNLDILQSGAWQQLMKRCASNSIDLTLYVPHDFNHATIEPLRGRWSRSGIENGSTLKVVPIEGVSHGIIIRQGQVLVASVTSEIGADDPLVIVFRPTGRPRPAAWWPG